jgi:hypothetical protein
VRAWLNLRYTVPERKRAFEEGLQALGYDTVESITASPGKKDILVTWNRIGPGDAAARLFASAGRPVIVTENASWGNDFDGARWYTLALDYHNKSGCFPVGGPERWDVLGVSLAPWRAGGETVILPQRGIGPTGIAMPSSWGKKLQGRIRPHPGRNQNPTPLEQDLQNAGKVITWGSGAAIKALIMGIPVESHMPNWIGEQDNTDEGRLAMFRRLAWAQWTLDEIRRGDPFRHLLGSAA